MSGFKDIEMDYDAMTAAAAEIPVGSEGLIFLPYLTGERTPHLDPLATGGFIGLTSRHTPAHLIRAVMEGVTFSLKDGLEIMHGLDLPIQQVRAIGGGGKSPLWCQMQADIFNCEVVTLEVEEGPAYGAALLAVGADKDDAGVVEVSERCVKIKNRFTPKVENQAKYERIFEIYRGLYPRLKNDMHDLMNLAMEM
jgi:xylulokinase